MKNNLFVALICSSLLFVLACNEHAVVDDSKHLMTKSDSALVIEKVMQLTDSFFAAHNRLDAEGVKKFWHYNDSDFMILEETVYHPRAKALTDYVDSFYKLDIDSTNYSWGNRKITPLSKKTAYFTGDSYYYLKLAGKEPFSLHVFYSGLFTEVDGKWAVLKFHESYNTDNK